MYTALFQPRTEPLVIVSGCYDHVIRVWRQAKDSFELLDELEHHDGYITSLCINPAGNVLYSGDNRGCILSWSIEGCNYIFTRFVCELKWLLENLWIRVFFVFQNV